MINDKESFLKLFRETVEGEESLDVYPEERNSIGYWDKENEYERIYYFNETPDTLKDRILMDEQVETFLNKDALSQFLINYLDPNVLMVLDKIAFVFDAEDADSKARLQLEKAYGDEYALEIGSETLGITWTERQMVLINVSKLVQSSVEIANEPEEYEPVERIFVEGLLQTIFHECRHLFYECNELVPIGKTTPYPSDGGREYQVEQYGNARAAEHFVEFYRNCIEENLGSKLDKMMETLNVILTERDER